MVALPTSPAAAPVRGSVFGPVLSASGTRFVVKTAQSPTGRSTVSIVAATVVSRQATGARKDLRRGACATATGEKRKDGAIAASRIALSQPVKGSCPAGTRGPGGRGRSRSGRRPPARRPAGDFGFAAGSIVAVDGSTIELKGPRGTTEVALAKTARISKTVRVAASAIRAKACALVRGTSTDGGVTVKAREVALTAPASGGCATRFRPPGRR